MLTLLFMDPAGLDPRIRASAGLVVAALLAGCRVSWPIPRTPRAVRYHRDHRQNDGRPSDSSRVTDSSEVIESLGITAVVRGRNVRPGRADGADAEPAAEGHQRRLGSKRVRAPRGSREVLA